MPWKARSTLRLGTRRSPLAQAQARQVAERLEALHPGLEVALVPIETRGDRLKGELAPLGGKGLFTRELERGLLDGSLDLAVHSLKDLPVELPEGLTVAAYPPRADARDALVSKLGASLEELPAGAVLLTGSLRRRAQILHRRPDLVVEGVRGNVGTRLEKWRARDAAVLVLAMAGFERLAIDGVPLHPLDAEAMLPAPGQGALAVEVKAGGDAEGYCRALDDPATAAAATAERYLVAAFGGDCTLPLAAWAEPADEGTGWRVRALLATPDGRHMARGEAVRGHPIAAAEACYVSLYTDGAEGVLERLKETV